MTKTIETIIRLTRAWCHPTGRPPEVWIRPGKKLGTYEAEAYPSRRHTGARELKGVGGTPEAAIEDLLPLVVEETRSLQTERRESAQADSDFANWLDDLLKAATASEGT